MFRTREVLDPLGRWWRALSTSPSALGRHPSPPCHQALELSTGMAASPLHRGCWLAGLRRGSLSAFNAPRPERELLLPSTVSMSRGCPPTGKLSATAASTGPGRRCLGPNRFSPNACSSSLLAFTAPTPELELPLLLCVHVAGVPTKWRSCQPRQLQRSLAGRASAPTGSTTTRRACATLAKVRKGLGSRKQTSGPFLPGWR